jgi:hypothetical protein
MTLRELLEQCQNLVDAGFGDSQVIKASDDDLIQNWEAKL